jgi:hypothetical protein
MRSDNVLAWITVVEADDALQGQEYNIARGLLTDRQTETDMS